MASEDMKELIYLISDLRQKDTEKFESHIKLMNEVVDSIREIANNVKARTNDISEAMTNLQNTINESLNSLLASINPSGIKDTTKVLDRIMTSMNKSIQGMNIDQAMNQIRFITGGISARLLAGEKGDAAPATMNVTEDLKMSGASQISAGQGEEIYGAVPESYKKKKEEKGKRDDKLIKPSDLFG
ncbi:MAG TPA: hypothetical protein VKK79_02875 [Candidatus Lokiarchaeia archaeon]|nr:hypothetical protein [Candidatus Lokiarchaeia archaeon]